MRLLHQDTGMILMVTTTRANGHQQPEEVVS